jgi:anaerobic selenocysteine-containing dehydrogenase
MVNGVTHLRTCPLCEAMCGLEVKVDDGKVTRIRADRDDVWSKGYLCPKGTTLGHLHDDPDRLRAPMVRDGDGFREVTWPEAFAEVERLLAPVLAEDGVDAVSCYIGNPTAHNFSLGRYAGAFVPMSGITQLYSAGTVDQWPKNVVGTLLYGGMWTIPVPDLDRTDFVLMLGANPAASQGSLMACPDVLGRIDAIRERGGRVAVVDPRRTKTADRAGEWVPIQPGTDALLLMAMVQVLFAEDLVDLAHLAPLVDGVGAVGRLAEAFTPEAVEAATRVPADTTRDLARALAAAPAGCVYGRIGTCNQEFGTLASWLVEVLNVLTGNLDRPGGSMFPDPVCWSLTTVRPPDQAEGWDFARWNSRVRGAPEVLGQYPVSCLAEEIDTPGEGRIRALVVIAGNPVISAPESDRLDAALPKLDAMISIDNWLNETSRHAHVILPGLSALEQPHYDDLIWGFATRNGANFSDAVFPPSADRPAEWQILLHVAAIIGGSAAADVDVAGFDDGYFMGVVMANQAQPGSPIADRDLGEILAATEGHGPERILDFGLRVGPHGDAYGANPGGLTLAELKAHPHGMDFGPLAPRLPEVLTNDTGRIDLAPAYITADVVRLADRLGRADEGLVLVSRRHLRSNNSWMHNVKVLVKGKERCTLQVNTGDADRLGLVDGARARVSSESGSLEVPVEVTDDIAAGVVCLPHGWGHDKDGTRLSVAREHAGVNNNVLAPGHLVDVPSGNAVVNGIPVEVVPA